MYIMPTALHFYPIRILLKQTWGIENSDLAWELGHLSGSQDIFREADSTGSGAASIGHSLIPQDEAMSVRYTVSSAANQDTYISNSGYA